MDKPKIEIVRQGNGFHRLIEELPDGWISLVAMGDESLTYLSPEGEFVKIKPIYRNETEAESMAESHKMAEIVSGISKEIDSLITEKSIDISSLGEDFITTISPNGDIFKEERIQDE